MSHTPENTTALTIRSACIEDVPLVGAEIHQNVPVLFFLPANVGFQ